MSSVVKIIRIQKSFFLIEISDKHYWPPKVNNFDNLEFQRSFSSSTIGPNIKRGDFKNKIKNHLNIQSKR
ncbi:hypothetical protein BpHYR1_021985 [Brachionus plicatilis]|uniref:Uncharacterized protein n=1 Tax=Brachionus plicatilis TaxID=10195 RepID=A0A3M7Q482_BRAPC|nr:hypothetical protein BpHYR1_021985 [Brachionus plicatilis]